ncbi:MAG: alpha-1,6-glucosidase domain-containing protein [Luteimonas sp.]
MHVISTAAQALRIGLLSLLCVLLGACSQASVSDTGLNAQGSNARSSAATAALPAATAATASNICDAPALNTVLMPLPTPAAGAAPGNVRVHYNRPDGVYADWGLHLWQIDASRNHLADYPGVAWPTPLMRSGIDDYGAYYDIAATRFTHTAAAGFGFIVHRPAQAGDPGADRTWTFSDGGEFWLRSGDATVYRRNPLAAPPDIDTVRVHYKRYDNGYAQWGLHLWPTSGIDVARLPGLAIGNYDQPVALSALPNYTAAADGSEVTFDLPVLNPQGGANRAAVEFIVHGLPSNPNDGVNNTDGWSGNIGVTYAALSIAERTGEVWLVQGTPTVFTSLLDTRTTSTIDARAVWLTRRLIRWPRVDASGTFMLYHSASGQIVAQRGQTVSGADGALAMRVANDVPANAAERFKYVAPGVLLAVEANDDARMADLLKQQLVLVQHDGDGRVLGATTAQIAGQLDDRYASAQAVDDLGVSVARGGRTGFRLWAPTAQAVTLCTYGPQGGALSQDAMRFDAATGTWNATRFNKRSDLYYRYAVQVFVRGVGLVRNLVTDPYSVSLDANSQHSYVADLSSPALVPNGWRQDAPPATVRAQEDMSIYELHVRDFSINDVTVPAALRGKYLAFAQPQSNGMKHLKALAAAGLTDVHLLPAYDIASVPETSCVNPAIPDAAADSDAQQAAVNAVRDADCFNWGYDPWHYTAPEGSYATSAADGAARIREFRTMVMALHSAGLRVGMDVVYNHTSASGQSTRSVLDRTVPGYYHRLSASGDIERSTCCDNTATENAMMAKLMIDSVTTWATQYGIDSFRFDLMAHQPRAVMERLRDEVSAAAGRPIELLGEGWNFGEVANGARFVQASQLSLNGSGIGTFSDRARDMIRGGSAFDGGVDLRRSQGYINGLYYADNGSGGNRTRADLLRAGDLIRVGLAGSLRHYVMTAADDRQRPLEQIDYNGQPAGYVSDPQEVVNYVENHDNQTLYDNNVYKLPIATSSEDRARVQILGAAITMFSQGIAYFHAGIDTLRSKSLDRNSYNSGDWFNRLDWSYADNNFGVGLPSQDDNGTNWSIIQPLLANPDLRPTAADIAWTRDAFRDLLKIRANSTLFRLRTADEVAQRLTFYNTGSMQQPTVLVGHLDGRGYDGAGFKELIYLVNVDTVRHAITIPEQRRKAYALHPVHRDAHAADRRARDARYTGLAGTFTVPPRSAVVFVVR